MIVNQTIEDLVVPQEYIDNWYESFSKYNDCTNYIKLLYVSDLITEHDFNVDADDNWYEEEVENYVNANYPWFTEYLREYHCLHSDKEILYTKINGFTIHKKDYTDDLSNLSVCDLMNIGM